MKASKYGKGTVTLGNLFLQRCNAMTEQQYYEAVSHTHKTRAVLRVPITFTFCMYMVVPSWA